MCKERVEKCKLITLYMLFYDGFLLQYINSTSNLQFFNITNLIAKIKNLCTQSGNISGDTLKFPTLWLKSI